ncbi:MAG: hypothetical protein ACRYF4_10725 [Janthinobacterium lividum]
MKEEPMQYLDPSEYVSFGLTAETSDDLVTAASAMIDSFCKRTSLAVTQYVERLRFSRNRAVQLSNTPLAPATAGASPLVSVRVRMRGCTVDPYAPLAFEAGVFYAGNQWMNVDLSTIDIAPDGAVQFQPNALGYAMSEAEVTYTAGFAVVPVPVKVACAQIVRNAQATPALNVRRQSIDSMQMEYFSGSLLDADVQRLLGPYVAERVG